jgi:hypothetical protein
LQLPEQQSQEELQDVPWSLQTSPLGLQPVGRVQTPTVNGAVMVQTAAGWPGRLPQQSEFCVQRSPTGWQPLAGWQTNTPVGPYGKQARLQHGPPHVAGVIPGGPQTSPSVNPQLDGPVGGSPQIPTVLGAVMLQLPPQQSAADVHTSFVWRQNEDGEQTPLLQNLEQHSVLSIPGGGGVHVLPRVLHTLVSGVQVLLAPQTPPQH